MSISRKYTSKGGRSAIGGKNYYFRSRWENIYARFLEFLKLSGKIEDWFYEPTTFWFLRIKRGVRSYKPDFKVIQKDGTHYWVEVKGYLDSKSCTKIKRFKKYYPQEILCLVRRDWFQKNSAFVLQCCCKMGEEDAQATQETKFC